MDFNINMSYNKIACFIMFAIFTWMQDNAIGQSANCVAETVFSVTIQSKPTAAFGFFANDLTATFSNSSINSISYSWDFGDPVSGSSNTSTEANPVHQFTAPGNYTVTLTAMNGCGSKSVTQTVQVACPTLVVAATADDPTQICPGASVLLTATPGFQNYQWLLGGNPIANSNAANFTASIPGEYTVGVTDAAGCIGSSQGISVEQLPLAQPSFSSTINALSAAFINTSIHSTTYSWDFGDPNSGASNTSSETNPIHIYSAPGTYLVTLTAMNTCGNQHATQTVVIACTPPQVSIASNSPSSFCEGGSTLLHAAPANLADYQWYLNDLPIPAATSSTLAVTAAGQYKVLASDSFGCENYSDVLVVTVYPLPTATIVSSTGAAICAGASLSLTGGFGTDYQWLTPDGTSIFGENITIPTSSISNNGTYHLTVTDGNGCSSTANFNLTVNPLPMVSISGINLNYTESDPPVPLIGIPPGGIFTGTGLTGNLFDLNTAGVGQHTIHYAYTDAVNCTNSDSVVVQVSPTSATHLAAVVGDIRVFPNPNHSEFWLEIMLSANKTLSFDLMNALGQTVTPRQESLPSGQSILHFDSNDLNSGVYYLKVLDGAQHAYLRVIVAK